MKPRPSSIPPRPSRIPQRRNARKCRRRGAALLGITALLALTPGVAQAVGFDGPRQLETVPGSRWLEPSGAVLTLATARPVALPGVAAGWLRVGSARASGLSASALLRGLRAGAVVRTALRASLSRRTPAGLWGGGLEGVDVEVKGVVRHQHLRLHAFLALGLGDTWMGVRWEGPRRPSPQVEPSSTEVALRTGNGPWALGVARRSSPYGGPPLWRLGLRVALSPGFLLAAVAGDAGSRLVVVAGRPGLRLRAALPLDGPLGAGPAVGMDLLGGGRP